MKNYFIITLLFIPVLLFSQQVARDKVVVEIGTGTWCTYCPGAAMGADDLISNGCEVAIIEYHNGDNYVNSMGTQRIAYYNVTGFPTAVFDGLAKVVGGDHNTSMYPQYIGKYNARKNVLSSYTIVADGSVVGAEYTLDVTIDEVFAGNNNNKKLLMALTESHIDQTWQGQSELNFVERLMAPNGTGTTLDFSSSTTENVTLTFSTEPSWDITNCEIVLFVQDLSTKEILQGMKMPLSDIMPTLTNDCALTEVGNIPTATCLANISAEATFKNYGLDNITSLELVAEIDGTTVTEFWSGDIAYQEVGNISFQLDGFTLSNSNTIVVEIKNPNGSPDQNPDDNEKSITFGNNPQTAYSPITLVLRTDNNPEEITWELINSSGDVLETGGPYTNSNQVSAYEWVLPTNDCYQFNIFDAGGNGICCENGNGLFGIEDAEGNALLDGIGGEFGYVFSVPFDGDANVGIEDEKNKPFTVFPNPTTGNIQIKNSLGNITNIKVFNISGQLVYHSETAFNTDCSLSIDLSGSGKGAYILIIEADGENYHEQIIVE